MRRISCLALLVFIFFAVEFVLANFISHWLRPNLLILLIIFVNSNYGIRYSLFVAFLAGLLKDCYSAGAFGIYLFSFIFCAYISTVIKRYFYELEADLAKIITTSVISLLCVSLAFLFHSLRQSVSFSDALIYIILPEVFMTTIIAIAVYDGLKKCVLRFSV